MDESKDGGTKGDGLTSWSASSSTSSLNLHHPHQQHVFKSSDPSFPSTSSSFTPAPHPPPTHLPRFQRPNSILNHHHHRNLSNTSTTSTTSTSSSLLSSSSSHPPSLDRVASKTVQDVEKEIERLEGKVKAMKMRKEKREDQIQQKEIEEKQWASSQMSSLEATRRIMDMNTRKMKPHGPTTATMFDALMPNTFTPYHPRSSSSFSSSASGSQSARSSSSASSIPADSTFIHPLSTLSSSSSSTRYRNSSALRSQQSQLFALVNPLANLDLVADKSLEELQRIVEKGKRKGAQQWRHKERMRKEKERERTKRVEGEEGERKEEEKEEEVVYMKILPKYSKEEQENKRRQRLKKEMAAVSLEDLDADWRHNALLLSTADSIQVVSRSSSPTKPAASAASILGKQSRITDSTSLQSLRRVPYHPVRMTMEKWRRRYKDSERRSATKASDSSATLNQADLRIVASHIQPESKDHQPLIIPRPAPASPSFRFRMENTDSTFVSAASLPLHQPTVDSAPHSNAANATDVTSCTRSNFNQRNNLSSLSSRSIADVLGEEETDAGGIGREKGVTPQTLYRAKEIVAAITRRGDVDESLLHKLTSSGLNEERGHLQSQSLSSHSLFSLNSQSDHSSFAFHPDTSTSSYTQQPNPFPSGVPVALSASRYHHSDWLQLSARSTSSNLLPVSISSRQPRQHYAFSFTKTQVASSMPLDLNTDPEAEEKQSHGNPHTTATDSATPLASDTTSLLDTTTLLPPALSNSSLPSLLSRRTQFHLLLHHHFSTSTPTFLSPLRQRIQPHHRSIMKSAMRELSACAVEGLEMMRKWKESGGEAEMIKGKMSEKERMYINELWNDLQKDAALSTSLSE